MAIHLWHTSRLTRELAHSKVSERDGMKYMLVASLLYTYITYWGLWFGAYRDWGFFFELAVVISIGLIGVFECYKANGQENGKDFVLRYCTLAVPIGIKVAVLGLVAGQMLYFGSDYVLTQAAFRNPDLVYRYLFFILSASLVFINYWRITHHIGLINAMERRTAENLENNLDKPCSGPSKSEEAGDAN
jgi:hypothetical protein